LIFLIKKKIDIQKISIKGLGASILRNKQASWEIKKQLDEILPKASEEEQKDEIPEPKSKQQEAEALKIKIGEVELVESHPIIFSDKSLNTPFNMIAEIKNINLSNVDTGNLDNTSHLDLHLVTDKHGNIKMKGDIQLLADAKSFDLNGEITGIDLRPVTSHIESALGHRVKSGQLNADIKLLSEKGQMDSLLTLNLKQFKLKALSNEQKEKLDKKMGLGMPLDTALELLRDRDNNIELKLPITGDVNNPDFDPSDAIYTASSKAITFAIINYYTPFGLVHAATGLFDLATALRFEPVKFNTGAIKLLTKQNESLNKIAKLLVERPQLHVTLCGFSNNDDLAVIAPELSQQLSKAEKDFKLDEGVRTKLLKISASRGEAVKLYLIEKKVNADRLILCEPEFKKEGVSGVEISI